jgi:CYTH domain-containing protein
MAVEIERKFLVNEGLLPPLPAADELWQGYLADDPAVRVRLRTGPDGARRATLTIKGRGLIERAEFEYQIPTGEALQLLGLCHRSLRKRRHLLGRWEIDQFPDRGLWLAEIELASADEPFERPPWLGAEVSGDPAYQNVNLAVRPGA